MIYDEMMALCYRENIVFVYGDLQYPLNGIYVSCDGLHTIMLANAIKDNHPLRNVVLAEEIGHHFTLAGNNLPKEHWNRLDRMNFTKDEARAIRWAAKYIMPIKKIHQSYVDGICTISSLAEYFEVTHNFVIFRMTLPDIQNIKYQEVI